MRTAMIAITTRSSIRVKARRHRAQRKLDIMTGLLQKQRNSPQAQCACGETRCLAGECKEGLARVAPTVIVGRREEATQRGKNILQEFHELASEIAPAKF